MSRIDFVAGSALGVVIALIVVYQQSDKKFGDISEFRWGYLIGFLSYSILLAILKFAYALWEATS